VDQDHRNWLDGEDEPRDCHDRHDVTPDEYFFITTLYGNMNLEGQRTMIRKSSAQGELATARLLTVSETCDRQGVNTLTCLSAAIASHRRRQQAHSLLPR
jgi:hypothetical protein